MRKIIFRGLIYDWSIEPLLGKIKQKVTEYILEYDLFPLLDLCCGTGKQCAVIKKDRKRIIGLDLDLKMVKYALSRYPQIPFVCGDASRIPFKDKSFNAIILSYALHEKPPELQKKIMDEARRLLKTEGKIIIIDFEKPWNCVSRLGGLLTWMIERTAGGDHYRNRQKFLKQGGLGTFITRSNLIEIERYNVELGNSSIVLAEFD